MATFPIDVTRGAPPLDFALLRDGPITAYHATRVLTNDLEWLEARGYVCDRFDAAMWKTPMDVHSALQAALGFTAGYGRNLNALSDSLQDLEIPSDSGRVLAFLGYRGLPCEAMLDVLARKSRWWLLFGRRLMVVIQTDDPHLRLPAVGAQRVKWNPREWLDAERLKQS